MLSTAVAAGLPEALAASLMLQQSGRVQREFVFVSNDVPDNTTLAVLRSARVGLCDKLQGLYPDSSSSEASVLNVSYEDAGDRLIHWRVSMRVSLPIADDPSQMTGLGADLLLHLANISVKIKPFSLHMWAFIGWHCPPAKD
ncbi:MAG TPA: hypothetical protein VNG90_03790 [Candidatus Acidoferrum sp.]|nr:hypothetical protein [Candidatus Acidoferrum sp.]